MHIYRSKFVLSANIVTHTYPISTPYSRGQPSAGSTTDFVLLAQSCGYFQSEMAIGMDDAVEKLKRLSEFSNGPAFLEIKLKPGTRSDLGRPTSSPLDNKNAFMDFLQER